MPPRTTFTREAIASTALELVREKGLPALTVRMLAERLGSSTAPVYSTFESMEGLEREVNARACALLLDYSRRAYTEWIFLNMGVGICVFAREEPFLFRAMFLESAHVKGNIEMLSDTLVEDMRKVERFAAMPRKVRMTLLTRMWTYTLGLATMISLGVLEDAGDEAIVRSLWAVGRVVTEAVIADHRRDPSHRNPGRPSANKERPPWQS